MQTLPPYPSARPSSASATNAASSSNAVTIWSSAWTPVDSRREHDPRARVQHLGPRRGPGATHVGDEVLGAEVRDGHRRAQQLLDASNTCCRLDAGEHAEPVATRGRERGRDALELRHGLELGHHDAREPGSERVAHVVVEPLAHDRVHAHVDGELRVLRREPRAEVARDGARVGLARRAAPRPPGRGPRRPARCAGSFATTSGRLAGANSRLRSRGPGPGSHLAQLLERQLLERFGVRERLDVLHRPAVHDVAHRELGELAAARPRQIRHRDDPRRDVARRRARADPAADLGDEIVGQRGAVAQDDEQHDPDVAVPFLADDEALDARRRAVSTWR